MRGIKTQLRSGPRWPKQGLLSNTTSKPAFSTAREASFSRRGRYERQIFQLKAQGAQVASAFGDLGAGVGVGNGGESARMAVAARSKAVVGALAKVVSGHHLPLGNLLQRRGVCLRDHHQRRCASSRPADGHAL